MEAKSDLTQCSNCGQTFEYSYIVVYGGNYEEPVCPECEQAENEAIDAGY